LRLKEKLNINGKSLYMISRETGIPYTTINELVNGKNDINRCPYETVARLAAYFRCDTTEIANPIQFTRNMHGTYRKIPFEWVVEGNTAVLHVKDGQKDIVLLRDSKMTQARFSREYYATAHCYIDIYLHNLEVQQLLCPSTNIH